MFGFRETVRSTNLRAVREHPGTPHDSPSCLPERELEEVASTRGGGMLFPFGHLRVRLGTRDEGDQ